MQQENCGERVEKDEYMANCSGDCKERKLSLEPQNRTTELCIVRKKMAKSMTWGMLEVRTFI